MYGFVKKSVLFMLTLTMVFALVVPASASDGGEVAPCFDEDTSDHYFICPYCPPDSDGNKPAGALTRQWWEYGYYYSRLWQEYKCPNCNKLWATMILEVSHPYAKKLETEQEIVLLK